MYVCVCVERDRGRKIYIYISSVRDELATMDSPSQQRCKGGRLDVDAICIAIFGAYFKLSKVCGSPLMDVHNI